MPCTQLIACTALSLPSAVYRQSRKGAFGIWILGLVHQNRCLAWGHVYICVCVCVIYVSSRSPGRQPETRKDMI